MTAGELAQWAGSLLFAAGCLSAVGIIAVATVLACSHILRAAYEVVNGLRSSRSRR